MRAQRALRLAAGEWRAFRAAAAEASSGYLGLVGRLRHHLDLGGVDRPRIAALEAELAALRAALASQEAALGGLRGDREAQRRTRLAARTWALTAWVEQAVVPPGPVVSVVMATRNRAPWLRRALESLRAQSYPRWELVAVDDGSTDATPAVLAEAAAADGRVRTLRTEHRGHGAARNRALAEATGELVAYLDDDNLMHPAWCKALVWAFGARPDVDVLYGARLLEDPSTLVPGAGTLPDVHLEPYDRRRLEQDNFVDLGALAHRAGLPEAHLDEDLAACGDWDLVLRLTARRPPLVLPVLSGSYSTSAPDRVSGSPAAAPACARVKARAWRTRPIRVLGYNSLFPLVTETYVGDELRALASRGAELAWCTDTPQPTAVTVAEPLFADVDEAVAAFDPDVLFLHWATFAEAKAEELAG